MHVINLPPLISHRGAAAFAPENTCIAMQTAKRFGAQWVEFDVMLSQEGEAICFHDDTLDRTTNGQGRVTETPWSVLQSLDAGSWFDKKFIGEKIPHLQQLIETIGALGLGMNVEIKPDPNRVTETVVKTLAVLDQHWKPSWPTPLITSFSSQALVEVRQRNPAYPLGVLLHTWNTEWEKFADAIHAITVHLNKKIVTEKIIQEIKKTGRAVLAYTINNRAEADAFFAQGVDTIFSDYPNLLG